MGQEVDRVMKMQEEKVMMVTKLGEHEVHGQSADISKAQVSSLPGC